MASSESVNNTAISEHENSSSNEQNSLLPHLESFERMMKFPVVEAAWQQSQGVYGKVKESNAMFNWAFRTAEDVIYRAANISAPLVHRLDRPIKLVDQTLVTGMDKLEIKAPIIKEQPQEIYNQAKTKVYETVQPHISKVCALRVAGQQKAKSLKELSWQKANEVLATQYGSMAVTGVDTTSALAERLLDYYFPHIETETDQEKEDENTKNCNNNGVVKKQHRQDTDDLDLMPISADEDPVLHTVQTVGRLSNKVARRVYDSVSRQVKVLKKEDVHEYVASLIAVLRLTQYLNFINEKVQSVTSTAITASSKNDKTE